MNAERINQLVAEECGWKPYHSKGGPMSDWEGYSPSGVFSIQEDLPKFSTSLDAIRAAAMERFKASSERLKFEHELQAICITKCILIWQLTALDWAEAFLRAVGKWEE